MITLRALSFLSLTFVSPSSSSSNSPCSALGNRFLPARPASCALTRHVLLVDYPVAPQLEQRSSSNCMPYLAPVWIDELMRNVLFSRIRLPMAGVTTSIS